MNLDVICQKFDLSDPNTTYKRNTRISLCLFSLGLTIYCFRVAIPNKCMWLFTPLFYAAFNSFLNKFGNTSHFIEQDTLSKKLVKYCGCQLLSLVVLPRHTNSKLSLNTAQTQVNFTRHTVFTTFLWLMQYLWDNDNNCTLMWASCVWFIITSEAQHEYRM